MIKLKELIDPTEIKRLEYLQQEVWGGESVVPAHMIIAGRFIGGILIGAYYNDELVGYVFGLPGFYEGLPCHYSHQLAVLPKYRNLGIGEKLKLGQRTECIKRGYDLVIWTFDPLQATNAHLNIRKLSCITRRYLVNHYGPMVDKLNRGLPSDRLLVEWWINSDWVNSRLNREYQFTFQDIFRKRISIALNYDISMSRFNIDLDLDDDLIAIAIPSNINEIKTNNFRLAKRWREISRKVFTYYLEKNYVVIDFLRDKNGKLCYYLLAKKFSIKRLWSI